MKKRVIWGAPIDSSLNNIHAKHPTATTEVPRAHTATDSRPHATTPYPRRRLDLGESAVASALNAALALPAEDLEQSLVSPLCSSSSTDGISAASHDRTRNMERKERQRTIVPQLLTMVQ